MLHACVQKFDVTLMLYACVQKFNVMDTVDTFQGTKRGLTGKLHRTHQVHDVARLQIICAQDRKWDCTCFCCPIQILCSWSWSIKLPAHLAPVHVSCTRARKAWTATHQCPRQLHAIGARSCAWSLLRSPFAFGHCSAAQKYIFAASILLLLPLRSQCDASLRTHDGLFCFFCMWLSCFLPLTVPRIG